MKTIKVAIAGFGKGANIYNAPMISSIEGLKITRILSSSQENIAKANVDFPDAEVVSDFEELLHPEIDLVVIPTPNHFHKTLAERALLAGKHVVVEKPFTPTVQEANELIELANKQKRILSVHHNRRWASDNLTIIKLLKEKRLGEIVEFEAHFDRFRPEIKEGWKEEKEVPGSGLLYDLGSHLIDQALILFGEPTEVFANLRTQRKDSRVPDNFEIILLYPTVRVILKAGMLVKEKGPTYSIHGRKGSFVKYGADPQEELMKQGLKPMNNPNWGIEPKEIWGKLNTIEESVLVESERGDYSQFYQNIYNSITGSEEIIVKPEEARDVIKIIELAIKSDKEKRWFNFK